MFEFRVKVLLALGGVALCVIVARLTDMQITHGDTYRRQAEDALLLPAKVLHSVRGTIFDRMGKELVSDQPSWDVKIDYGVLAMDSGYLASRAARFRRQQRYEPDLGEDEVEHRFLAEIERMWGELTEFSGQSIDELRSKATSICQRIRNIRVAVTERRGFDTPVREERMAHAILAGLNDQDQVLARARFDEYPWVSVEASTRRIYRSDESFAHILGRLGPVTAKALEDDRFANDPLRKYLGGERLGVSGVARAAEHILRGRRGRVRQDRRDRVIENTPPERGGDVHLTIRSDLQRRLYEMFAQQIDQQPDSAGGTVIVLDIPTREVLAMISYPGYDPSLFSEQYAQLRRDTRRQPLRFRAVANRYAPGSIVKPLTILAGLGSGRITLDTSFTCNGSLFAAYPNKWRCWQAAGSGARMRHGPLACEEAIKHSCNVFMYRTGQATGVEYLTNYFEMVGFGRPCGTGLIEEVRGINPTPSWLATYANRSVTIGHSRLFAIGQGELSITPLQAANLMAVYASGVFRPVTLVRELNSPGAWTLPGDPSHWAAIRRGMFRVVNEVGGTARKTARLESSDRWAIVGKTGSASVVRGWPVSYKIPYTDPAGQQGIAIQFATRRAEAIGDFVAEHLDCSFDKDAVMVNERWPNRPRASGDYYSHAWFVGYLQEIDAGGQPLWHRQPRVAFAVLVEFGGSGGWVSGPIGKRTAEILIETLGPDLDPDAPASSGPPSLRSSIHRLRRLRRLENDTSASARGCPILSEGGGRIRTSEPSVRPPPLEGAGHPAKGQLGLSAIVNRQSEIVDGLGGRR